MKVSQPNSAETKWTITCITSPIPSTEVRDYCNYDRSYSEVYYPNGTRVTTGYAQFCVNGSTATVCASGLNDATVQQYCQQERSSDYGYVEQSSDIHSYFYPPITQMGISYINCSSYYLLSDYCSYQVTYDHCAAYGGPALITCVDEPYGKSAWLLPQCIHLLM